MAGSTRCVECNEEVPIAVDDLVRLIRQLHVSSRKLSPIRWPPPARSRLFFLYLLSPGQSQLERCSAAVQAPFIVEDTTGVIYLACPGVREDKEPFRLKSVCLSRLAIYRESCLPAGRHAVCTDYATYLRGEKEFIIGLHGC